jgi:hypothetical protein
MYITGDSGGRYGGLSVPLDPVRASRRMAYRPVRGSSAAVRPRSGARTRSAPRLGSRYLVAVTSLVAADDGGARGAARLGAWWGLGHALTLLALGLPLIALKYDLPAPSSQGRRRQSASRSPSSPAASYGNGLGGTIAPDPIATTRSAEYRGRRPTAILGAMGDTATIVIACAPRGKPSRWASCTGSPGPGPWSSS